MSIFGKPVSQLSFIDLQELLDVSAIENVRLEFKERESNKDQTVKKLSSFANTFGGYLVVGAAESEGRISRLSGIDPPDGYKQKIVDWCFAGVYPPLTVEVSDPIPGPNGDARVCYVVHVPESDLTPHFLNERKGLYIRTDEYSSRFEARLANEAETRHLLNKREAVLARRSSLLQRARRRWQTYTDTSYGGFTGACEQTLGSQLQLSIGPRFPSRELVAHSALNTILRGNRIVNWRQVGFPRTSHRITSQHESEIVLQPGSNFSLFEANILGMLFYATEIDRNESGLEGFTCTV